MGWREAMVSYNRSHQRGFGMKTGKDIPMTSIWGQTYHDNGFPCTTGETYEKSELDEQELLRYSPTSIEHHQILYWPFLDGCKMMKEKEMGLLGLHI
jgi:hypothetical protein